MSVHENEPDPEVGRRLAGPALLSNANEEGAEGLRWTARPLPGGDASSGTGPEGMKEVEWRRRREG